MGNLTSNDQMRSNEKPLKEVSNDSNDHMNGLTVKERDYMIAATMRRLGVEESWRPVVARAANYISGPRFWEIAEYAEKARSKAHCFIKCLNNEMYR